MCAAAAKVITPRMPCRAAHTRLPRIAALQPRHTLALHVHRRDVAIIPHVEELFQQLHRPVLVKHCSTQGKVHHGIGV